MTFQRDIARSWSNRRARRRAGARALMAAGVAVALVALAAGDARAHQASVAHARALVSDDLREVELRILLSPPDTAEAFGLREDQAPSAERVDSHAVMLLNYLIRRISIRDGDHACPVIPGDVELVEDDGTFVASTWRVECPEPITELVIDYQLFFDIDPLHLCILRVIVPGRDAANAQLRSGEARFRWKLGEPPPSSTAGFVRSGVDHIVFGFDHIAFLVGLLLIIAITREDGIWRVREIGAGLKYTGLIVTSFTVAHSITLIAASLDWVEVPTRPVEILIAATIVYVAVENVVAPATRYRYVLTFVFGLVHGLGFAAMLQVLLPPDDVVVPLLAFNVGVELGQLAFVIVVLPLLHVAARILGPESYKRWIIHGGSAVLAILGALWLIERAANVTILGF